ncbi:serine/threonine-protein kinase [Polyangium mundeleinium]|uniref:Serine/threonine-protein kinase n=1 Tax=Polyangium mundeleinium TaxID=2995306 RepID=A0ABT5F3W6_9BACT|nr:serine/threonine-protein kinase [Polyangium mundeleinium]MDC0748304.1 serine/threonine-protein kinase [Polyangium mundeleinium]
MLPGLSIGQILHDKYRVERVLGAGGMGVVVAARHLALDQLVAIKLMHGAASPADVGRFVREARAASRLRSQHVARVLDVSALDDGTPYITMEHLEGHDLAHVLRERGPLPIADAVDILLQACEAIGEAHTLGIVHRDLKPANLFLAQGVDGLPCVKVLDFGIAKWATSGTERLDPTRPMGSAPYMAPEQIAAPERLDARADVWALGAAFFHMLSGKPPFHHEGVCTAHAMIHAVLHRPPLPLRVLRPEVPPELEAVVMACLEKDMSTRLPSVAALSTQLSPFGSEHAAVYSRRIARMLGAPDSGPVSTLRSASPREVPSGLSTAQRLVSSTTEPTAATRPAPGDSGTAPRARKVAGILGVTGLVVFGVVLGAKCGARVVGDGAAAPVRIALEAAPEATSQPTSTTPRQEENAPAASSVRSGAAFTSTTAAPRMASSSTAKSSSIKIRSGPSAPPPLPSASAVMPTPQKDLYGSRH